MERVFYRLSQKKSANGRQQVIVKLVINGSCKPCFRSGVYVMADWFKTSGACKSKSNAVGKIKVPNKGKFNAAEISAAQEAERALTVYAKRLDTICQVTEAIDKEKLDKKWVENAERVIRIYNVKTEEITYNKIVELLEQDETKEAEAQALSFFEVWDKYIAQHRGTKRRIDHIKVMKRALQRFEIYSGCVLDLGTFDSDSLGAFNRFLQDEHTFFEEDLTTKKKSPKSRYKHIYEAVPETHIPKERSENYRANFFKVLRAFFTWAVKNDFVTNDPFRKFSISEKIAKEIYGTPFYLTIAERNILYKYVYEDKRLSVQRDIFVFQCCVGCRVGDLYRFTKSNIILKGGTPHISYIPSKTVRESGKNVEVPLNNIAQEILAKYETHKGGRGRRGLFPFVAEQHYNEAIREMLKVAGIDRVVSIRNPRTKSDEQHPLYEVASSHMARRTFINGMYQRVKDPNIVGSMSGHAFNSKAFERYREIDDKIKMEAIMAMDAVENA